MQILVEQGNCLLGDGLGGLLQMILPLTLVISAQSGVACTHVTASGAVQAEQSQHVWSGLSFFVDHIPGGQVLS